MSTRAFGRSTVLAGAVLFAAALSACSDDGSDADASTSATTSGTAASTTSATSSVPSDADQGSTGGSDGIAVGEPPPGGGSGDDGGDGGDGIDGGGGPVDDRCSVEALQQAYGGEVTQVGSVGYCDGDWAVSGNAPNYLNQPFMHREHGWVVFVADSSNPGVGHECYTADYLDQLGVPDEARSLLTACYAPEPSGTITATPQE